MSIVGKREALASIKKRTRTIDGRVYHNYDAYLGTNPMTGEIIRFYSKDPVKLRAKIDQFYYERKQSGDLTMTLSVVQLMDAKLALYELERAGASISLLECAKHEVERLTALSVHPKKVGEAYDEFLAEKNGTADRSKTKSTTGKWVERFGRDRLLSEVTAVSVEEYLKTHYGKNPAVTYNSHLTYIRTFMNWCGKPRRKYVTAGVLDELETREEVWEEPKYMAVADVEKLMRALERHRDDAPDCLAHCITNLFCGVRREESLRMSEGDAARIHLDDETVRISKVKGYTQGRAPRAFQIPPNALAWMRSFPYERAILTVTEQTTKRIKRLAAEVGVKTFRNFARHSFITYHVAAYGDPAKTQAMVGTSAKMRADHYCGLASKRDGEAFFAIYPSGSPEASGSAPSA